MKSKLLIGSLSIALLFGLMSCADTNDETVTPNNTVEINSTSDASSTQLAGEETPSVNENGDTLVGGDAVAGDETPGEASFTVLGSNYEYDIKEMRVKEGDEVSITFRSVDGFHDWVVDEFDAATEKVETDGETTVTFIADKTGTFEYYCSVGQHRANGMVGTLIVE
ncbi:multicopper oxidase domain-containing protein [Candidatus Gracilibacteria bacterium]|nr:multicopper oxidase domain-containing protein [Candidatus Gracilibacteria bacterium]